MLCTRGSSISCPYRYSQLFVKIHLLSLSADPSQLGAHRSRFVDEGTVNRLRLFGMDVIDLPKRSEDKENTTVCSRGENVGEK